MSKDQGTEREKRWPELELGQLQRFGDVEFFEVRPDEADEYETCTYVPVSSPRCLSKEEADLLGSQNDWLEPDELEAKHVVERRLLNWAGEGTES